ncbi:acetyltransferase, GNAT family [Dictyocaulus viviparus]|uniref:N-terminal methionine N(alpha)-acetyltransferase NatE n=1 Tax=Dictyocaulus viviparus TaxID=29172 RepID=A0A0D8XED6_DICVI|nr:acetyltransferase, GNAT family [Dictyocaulus viviparus]
MELVQIDANNLRSVKNLHAGIFPIVYSDKFFKQIQNNELCSVLMLNGNCVGAVCCKYELVGCLKALYIMSLGVSSGLGLISVHPLYRCRGLGAKLLDFATSKAVSHCVSIIRLHVQINNSAAIEFYSKRGFAIIETVPNYYHRCAPADAHVMHRVL